MISKAPISSSVSIGCDSRRLNSTRSSGALPSIFCKADGLILGLLVTWKSSDIYTGQVIKVDKRLVSAQHFLDGIQGNTVRFLVLLPEQICRRIQFSW